MAAQGGVRPLIHMYGACIIYTRAGGVVGTCTGAHTEARSRGAGVYDNIIYDNHPHIILCDGDVWGAGTVIREAQWPRP